MRIAERISSLGTETAFAVSAEAAAHAAQGHKVYPFHIGDMNLRTPVNIIEAAYRAMNNGSTGYCSNYGLTPLREALAEDINRTRGTHYKVENVAIQPGGKPTISKFLQTLMNPGDEVLYPNPGFPIYESQIEYFGGVAVAYGFKEGNSNFELQLDQIEASITPKTRLLILNDLHNPTGAEASARELERLSELIVEHDLYVLTDEAYFDIRYDGVSRSLASLPGMESRCVILQTFSKKFAMTGWRLGATIGPKTIIDIVAKLNVNIESCSNHFIQHAAIEALQGDQQPIREMLRVLKDRRDTAHRILSSIDGIRCYRPNVTFYLFPNVTELMNRLGIPDYETLRVTVLRETGVSFCTRMHFGRPLPDETHYYIRLAYSGINADQIEEGLSKLKAFTER